jgi:hypothetical protein
MSWGEGVGLVPGQVTQVADFAGDKGTGLGGP